MPRSHPGEDLPYWRALVAPVLAHAFDELKIGVSLWTDPSVALWTNAKGVPEQWYAIHSAPNIVQFEMEQGKEARRYRYNDRSFAQVRKERKVVRGTHGGFHDLFMPVGEGAVRRILVAGPFATSRPTSGEVRERWQALTGSHGRLTDPSFAAYLSMTLSTLTLDGSLLGTFERLMSHIARSVTGKGAAGPGAADAGALRRKIDEARFAERMWNAAHEMVDERTGPTWSHVTLSQLLLALGLGRTPQHAIVGLALSREDEVDPVDDLIRRDAFQRASAELARKLGGVVSGRVGDHGVTLLVDYVGSEARTRARLGMVAERAAACAKHFDLRLHMGVGQAEIPFSLAARYRGALWAAEKALSHGLAVVKGEPRPVPSTKHLRDLRNNLASSVGQRSTLLSPRFDGYIDAALVHCGYQLEPTRVQLESGLERLAGPLLATGALDERSFDNLYEAMERAAGEARTVTALVARYRRLVSDIQSAVQNPRAASQDRSVRRAIDFIREHLGEQLSLPQVSRVAGFAPSYFSRLFKREEGLTFERYLRKLRIASAQKMLSTTALSIARIATLCGFTNRSYFYRVFKSLSGVTPVEYRTKTTAAHDLVHERRIGFPRPRRHGANRGKYRDPHERRGTQKELQESPAPR